MGNSFFSQMKSVMKRKFIFSIFFLLLLCFANCKKDEPVEPPTGYYPRQLTQGNLDNRAFLSPDGKNIAFYSMRYTFNPEVAGVYFELWAMDSDGFDQRRLLLGNSIFPQTSSIFLYWEADSKSMIVQINDDLYGNYSKSEIWRIGIDGKRTQLYAPKLRLQNVTYSPDRKKLAYIIQGPNPPNGSPVYKLYVANPDFTDSVRIEKGLINDYVWQGDSKGLIYSLYDRPNENFDLWMSKIDGTGKLRFSETPESEEYLSISSDGKYLAYYADKLVYITTFNKFAPQFVRNSFNGPGWIPNRDLLFVTDEQTDSNGSYWTELSIIDKEGTTIKKFPKGVFEISFSVNSKYYLYTLNGNIWMDYLP